jgi:hypothetical protein
MSASCQERLRLQPISGLPRRVDVAGRGRLVLQLSAQLADVRVHGSGHGGVRGAPDVPQEIVPRDDFATAVPEGEEKVKLLRGEVHRTSPLRDETRGRPELHVPGSKRNVNSTRSRLANGLVRMSGESVRGGEGPGERLPKGGDDWIETGVADFVRRSAREFVRGEHRVVAQELLRRGPVVPHADLRLEREDGGQEEAEKEEAGDQSGTGGLSPAPQRAPFPSSASVPARSFSTIVGSSCSA